MATPRSVSVDVMTSLESKHKHIRIEAQNRSIQCCYWNNFKHQPNEYT